MCKALILPAVLVLYCIGGLLAQGTTQYPSTTSNSTCFCTKVFRPVCGANGQNYSNSCVAQCAGVQVAANGTCAGTETTTPFADPHTVPPGVPTGTGQPSCVSSCLTITTPATFPVCGADGLTYPTFCDAICAHVNYTNGVCTASTSTADPLQS